MKAIKFIFILQCMIFTTCASAQTIIKFTYDAAGNRTERSIYFGKSSEAPIDSASTTKPITDWIKEMKITIYPNPTRGQLTVEIANMPEDVTGEVTLFSLEGKPMQQQKILKTSSPLDISAYPMGMYILRVQVGPDKTEWKIVKE